MNLEGMSISEYRILLGKTHPDLEKILQDSSVVGTVKLLNNEGYYDKVFAEVEFFEVQGSNRSAETWRLGFYRNEQKAQERIVEETKLDKKLKLRHRRYFIVTHVFRD